MMHNITYIIICALIDTYINISHTHTHSIKKTFLKKHGNKTSGHCSFSCAAPSLCKSTIATNFIRSNNVFIYYFRECEHVHSSVQCLCLAVGRSVDCTACDHCYCHFPLVLSQGGCWNKIMHSVPSSNFMLERFMLHKYFSIIIKCV